MTFKPALWRPISIGLAAINLVGVGFAAGAAEPWHAGVHAVLALAFGVWAERLGRRPGPGQNEGRLEGDARLDAFEADLANLRRELTEAQERLDFAERVLTQQAETRRVGPER